MNHIEQAQTLLRIAYRDFNALQGMTDSPLFAAEFFGFHAQQAIEKALKAWLCAKNLIYPLSHELPRLLTLLENNGAHIDAFYSLHCEPDGSTMKRNPGLKLSTASLNHRFNFAITF